jgi:hypothetical protein
MKSKRGGITTQHGTAASTSKTLAVTPTPASESNPLSREAAQMLLAMGQARLVFDAGLKVEVRFAKGSNQWILLTTPRWDFIEAHGHYEYRLRPEPTQP